jgi:hypothetical protein
LHEIYKNARPLNLSARSKNNNIKYLQVIKNAIDTTHQSTMELKPKPDDQMTFLKKVEDHVSIIRKKLNEEQKKKENTQNPKIMSILGEIDLKQLAEQSHYEKLLGSGPNQIKQRHLLNADLYLLENNPREFIVKYNLDKRNLTDEEMNDLLAKFKFKAMSEKFQSMTNIAKRDQKNIEQNSLKMVNYLDKKITELSNQQTSPENIRVSSENKSNSRLTDYFKKRDMQVNITNKDLPESEV